MLVLFGVALRSAAVDAVVAPPAESQESRPTTVFAGSTPSGKRTITLELHGGGPQCHLERASFVETVMEPPPDVVFADGIVEFVASGCSPGSTVSLTLILPAPPPAGSAFWWYGPASPGGSSRWDAAPSTISANAASFRVTDGRRGDDDLKVNGTISGRAGLGTGARRAPAMPEGVVAIAGNASVALRWNATPSAIGYTIKRATAREGPYASIATNQPDPVFVDRKPVNGTTYFYSVRAIGGGGESADSPPLQVTPTGPKQVTACGVEPMTAPRPIPCPSTMAGTIIEEEVYVCQGARWQSTGWRVKESMCTPLDTGSAPATTF